MPDATKLPESVGFAITEMIDAGWFDDCLEMLAAHTAVRRAALAAQRARNEAEVRGILKPTPRQQVD